jgi:glycosyltransferase involved in cell wall biosynthesis
MLGTTHSWAVTLRSLLKEFELMGHDLYLESINDYDMFPEDWKRYKKNCKNADIELTYTLPRNFRHRFNKDSALKLAIYNYETSILPKVWKKEINHIDYVLPSSSFSKEVFVNSGWPEEKCIVVPHGISLEDFEDKSKVKNLKTKKSFKFLNVSIPHYRKNINTLVDAYYSEFTDRDDVCLLIKTSLSKPRFKFECNVVREILKAQKKHKGKPLPQVEIVKHRYDSMVPLYNTCDCLVSASSSEGFGLPLLEALAADMLVISPGRTGQADFLNKKNSLVVEAKKIEASKRYQYWRSSPGAETYMPRVGSLAENMRLAFEGHKELKKGFRAETLDTINKFTWKNAAEKILEIK